MKYLVPLALLALAACDGNSRAPAASASPGPAAGSSSLAPGGAVQDFAAPTLTPAAEQGEKGARNVLLEWARALERRDFAAADAQWGVAADQAGSAAGFGRFKTITVGIGEGAVEGGAGSLYYEVPVTVTGVAEDGTAQRLAGSVTARRVNDVDGASPAQLRWHLAGLNLAG